jgi:hypothetical protein
MVVAVDDGVLLARLEDVGGSIAVPFCCTGGER